MSSNHEPVHHRPAGADRCETPADVCGTCSDFEAGSLVPVSFCTEAAAKSREYHDWLSGSGERPDWLDSGDAARGPRP